MSCSTVNQLVYDYLIQNGCKKAAKSFSKSVNLKEPSQVLSPSSLFQLYELYKSTNANTESSIAEEVKASVKDKRQKNTKTTVLQEAANEAAQSSQKKKHKRKAKEPTMFERLHTDENNSSYSNGISALAAVGEIGRIGDTDNKNELNGFSANELNNGKEKKRKKYETFKRIDEKKYEEIAVVKNNSFWSKEGDEFAVKAATELGRVKGKDFRHEKSKKKRASWKGMGMIPAGINSIPFDCSD